MAAGTSAAMLAWTDGPAAAVLDGVGVPVLDEPPHAASIAAGTRSAIPTRLENVTLRPMSNPRIARELNELAIVDRIRLPCPAGQPQQGRQTGFGLAIRRS